MFTPPQVVRVRNKFYFVCDYTGVLITKRYFFPAGANDSQKLGTFCSLPVALRYVLDQGIDAENLEILKREACRFFAQPDIPIQPAEPKFQVGVETLAYYLSHLPLGNAWLIVPGSETIETYQNPVPEAKILRPVKKRFKPTQYFRIFRGAFTSRKDKSILPITTLDDLITALFRKGKQCDIRLIQKPNFLLLGSSDPGPANPIAAAMGHFMSGEVIFLSRKAEEIEVKILEPEFSKESLWHGLQGYN